ncbi:hypothetical protein lpbnt_00216 [Legionella pneumophila]|nr:hypothetical protein lpbnt_00216 [Legionella pneumophila]GAN19234.1 hypothetical protein lpofk_00217 [Legionella pneumophila]GAN28597.1 hypothetical protein lpymt_00176 [Legionella pneumophila]
MDGSSYYRWPEKSAQNYKYLVDEGISFKVGA